MKMDMISEILKKKKKDEQDFKTDKKAKNENLTTYSWHRLSKQINSQTKMMSYNGQILKAKSQNVFLSQIV